MAVGSWPDAKSDSFLEQNGCAILEEPGRGPVFPRFCARNSRRSASNGVRRLQGADWRSPARPYPPLANAGSANRDVNRVQLSKLTGIAVLRINNYPRNPRNPWSKWIGIRRRGTGALQWFVMHISWRAPPRRSRTENATDGVMPYLFRDACCERPFFFDGPDTADFAVRL
jgi:hypothetical protein